MIFRVDFDKWVLTLLPSFLRRSVMFALCRATIAPIRTLYGRFGEARKAHLFALTHNGQVCYLRSALNEAFDTTGFDIIDYDDGRGEYEVEWSVGRTEYSCDVDAVTGAILSYDKELD